jgi:general stress protein YciG
MTELEKHGFAALTPERLREIARMGGRAVPKRKRFFSRDRAGAREAGRKGGLSVKCHNRSFARNPDMARAAGRKGGLATLPAKRTFSIHREIARAAGERGRATRRAKRLAALKSSEPGEASRPGSEEGSS